MYIYIYDKENHALCGWCKIVCSCVSMDGKHYFGAQRQKLVKSKVVKMKDSNKFWHFEPLSLSLFHQLTYRVSLSFFSPTPLLDKGGGSMSLLELNPKS